jgi:hypothetical protein
METNNNYLAEDHIMCLVCNDGDYEEIDLIVFCSICQLGVHQSCYGINNLTLEDWICDSCRISPEEELDCILCPVKGGAMKQCNLKKTSTFYNSIINLRPKKNLLETVTNISSKLPDDCVSTSSYNNNSNISNNINSSADNSCLQFCINEDSNTLPGESNRFSNANINSPFKVIKNEDNNFAWIHMSCALWIEEVQFDDFTIKENIKNIESIDKNRFKDCCNICELKNYGPTVKCSYEFCKFKFHVECARINHYCFEVLNIKGMV